MTLDPRFAWLDGLQEAVWLVDAQTLRIVHANQVAGQLVRMPAADMAGRPVIDLAATPEDFVFWSAPPTVVADGIHSLSHLLRSDGTLVAVERRVGPAVLPDGRPAFLLTALDRSGQVDTERELETLLSELRATLDSAADGMLVCGLGGQVRAFNQRLAQLWSIPSGLLLQRDDEAIHRHMASQVVDAAFYRERLDEIAREPLKECTDLLSLRNGTILERRAVPQFLHGNPAGRVYSFRDITRQTEVQASLRLAARVFESSLDAIFIADSQHHLIRMNPGCEKLVGPSAPSFMGCMAAALFGCGSDAAFMQQVQSAWDQEGYWEGELWLPRDNEAYCAVQLSWVALRDDEGRLVQSIGFMRDLTQQHAAQKRIEELAYSDVLTGLPNRLLLSQRVETAVQGARQTDTGFAILFLDLDRFKIINDSLGHPFGDRVLQLVAERIQGCLRQTDMLCRLGGDEFVVYLHGAGATIAENVARRILDDMLRPFMLDDMGFSIQCSIGIALYPQDGKTLDDLIKQADTAMYRVKELGRGSYGFYQPQMNANLLSRMKLEHAMRQAIGSGHMDVHFQPQVDMATGRITGAEALARWTDPELGAVSPAQFIPLAEESGYIVTLGAWVMERSIQRAAGWMQAGTPVVVSVNVSALEFRQPDFVDRLTRLLAVYHLPPAMLELELTESILLQDAQEMEARLRELSALGIGLAIDDFGTGYSSLAYLKKLPIHKLKIDQSFVRGLPDDEGDRAIIRAIISIGQALHIEVVAEGVENSIQREVLQALQCDHYQGFLCSPAVPSDLFAQLLQLSVAAPWVPPPAPPRRSSAGPAGSA